MVSNANVFARSNGVEEFKRSARLLYFVALSESQTQTCHCDLITVSLTLLSKHGAAAIRLQIHSDKPAGFVGSLLYLFYPFDGLAKVTCLNEAIEFYQDRSLCRFG